ncbi:MAG TPA: VCBS repeat-containing protein [Rhodanobacteraceae bacterium]|nr:VCBS repeat-containing protein [Rhodanobacteraceae bacterium]
MKAALATTLATCLATVALAAGLGQADGSGTTLAFENVTTRAIDRGADSDYRFDALWTDFNGDGCPDPFIFAHADQATSRLWLNRCDGSHHFTLADNAQVRYDIAQPAFPRGSGWLTAIDFNGDGRQDFWTRDAQAWAARYLNATPPGAHLPHFAGKQRACNEHCILADINGDDHLDVIHSDGRIETLATGAPLTTRAGGPGLRLAADLDGDSWSDLLQPAAGGYWRNEHGALEWRPVPGLRGNTNLMLAADLDNDGDFDLFTFSGDDNGGDGRAHLYRNDGDGRFSEVTDGSGFDALRFLPWWTSYGNVIAADFDNDGRQDLLVAGASRDPSVMLLRNLGGLRFAAAGVDLGAACHGSEACKSRAAVADYDNDGRLDIVKTQDGSNVGIWRNVTDTGGNHWMGVRLRGAGANSDGLGTDVRWLAPGTGQLLAHMHVAASEQHPQTWLHTGVGDHPAVDLEVRFPHGGPRYRFDNLASDQQVVVYADGCMIIGWQPGDGWPRHLPVSVPAGPPVPREAPRPPPREQTAVGSARAAEAWPPPEQTICVDPEPAPQP